MPKWVGITARGERQLIAVKPRNEIEQGGQLGQLVAIGLSMCYLHDQVTLTADQDPRLAVGSRPDFQSVLGGLHHGCRRQGLAHNSSPIFSMNGKYLAVLAD